MVNSGLIFRYFLGAALFITLLHFLFHPVRILGMDTSAFYMDEKTSFAAYFTTITTFLVGFFTLNIVPKLKNLKLEYLILGLFFVTLSVDEVFEMHEYANTVVKSLVSKDDFWGSLAHFSWLFPLSLLVIAVLFVMIRLCLKEPEQSVRKPLIYGVGVYILVLVFEVIGSAIYGNPLYLTSVGIEEGLEMVGASLFLLASLKKYNLALSHG